MKKEKKKRIFLFFLHFFFEERIEKILIISGEIRKKKEKMDLAKAKKVFSASRQKRRNLFKVLAVIVFLKALLFSG